METFKLACTWEVYAIADVEAETLEEAIEKVESDEYPIPIETEYVDGSFRIDSNVSGILTEAFALRKGWKGV